MLVIFLDIDGGGVSQGEVLWSIMKVFGDVLPPAGTHLLSMESAGQIADGGLVDFPTRKSDQAPKVQCPFMMHRYVQRLII